MPLRPATCRTTSRTVFAGQTQWVILLKRGNDLKQGTVRAIKLFRCRRDSITKTGQTLEAEMATGNQTTWFIPNQQLKRKGVQYLNALDRIYDPKLKEYWEPETGDTISQKLFGQEWTVTCKLTNPPLVNLGANGVPVGS